jgi:hypothetical protein
MGTNQNPPFGCSEVAELFVGQGAQAAPQIEGRPGQRQGFQRFRAILEQANAHGLVLSK